MSLFPSAFDTGAATSSSSQLLSGTKGNKQKRKRPSSSGDHDKNDQIRSTQANLEKLMAKIEKGGIKEKEEGREGMGYGVNKKKKAKKVHGDEAEVSEKPAQKVVKEVKPALGTGTKNKKSKGDKAEEQEVHSPAGQKKRGGPLAPAELPFASPSLLKKAAKKNKVASASAGGENLTDLQKGMQAKLEGARFRWINEQLYSTPSTEAVAMMKKDPKIFADYHMTHRVLTSAWPSPPLEHIISLLTPLPAKTLIVDLGCGDAGLARALVPQGKIVLSYDLVGDSGVPNFSSSPVEEESNEKGQGKGKEGWVVEADFLEKIPLPGRPGGLSSSSPTTTTTTETQGDKKSSNGKKGKNTKAASNASASAEIVDVVVCCLSLMGTNWVGGIYEACRVLKQGGIFHIAEVTSRFTSTEEFVNTVESFGLSLEEETSPSTHFTLFRFVKTSQVPLGPARGERGWNDRVGKGQEILRACVYKKR